MKLLALGLSSGLALASFPAPPQLFNGARRKVREQRKLEVRLRHVRYTTLLARFGMIEMLITRTRTYVLGLSHRTRGEQWLKCCTT